MSRSSRRPGREARNAVARDGAGRRLFVTGKNRPARFEIETVEPAP